MSKAIHTFPVDCVEFSPGLSVIEVVDEVDAVGMYFPFPAPESRPIVWDGSEFRNLVIKGQGYDYNTDQLQTKQIKL
jgi:hypothetical protein